jgi:hypothetical protein
MRIEPIFKPSLLHNPIIKATKIGFTSKQKYLNYICTEQKLDFNGIN